MLHSIRNGRAAASRCEHGEVEAGEARGSRHDVDGGDPPARYGEALKQSGLPETTRSLIHLRASQINGCSYCVDLAARELREQGVRDPRTDQRLATVAAWRDAPCFSDAERAALALTEAAVRLSDRSDPVPDAVWEEAARHYDEAALAAVLVQVGATSFWNHVNVPIRQGPVPTPAHADPA